MSVEELQLVNGFIGFFIPSGGTWPTPFVEHEYEITGLEHGIETSVDGEIRTPVPELISTSTKVQHCVLLEAKSGSVNDRQAKAYKAITTGQIIIQGLATAGLDESKARLDVIYITSQSNSARLSADLGRAGVDFPLIEHDDTYFKLIEGTTEHSQMREVFEAGIEIVEAAWPTHFVRCDRDSSEGVLAALCMQKLISILYRKGEAEVEQIAAESIDLWDLRGQSDQSRLKNKLASLISEAEVSELKGQLVRIRPHRRWRLSANRQLGAQVLERLSDQTSAFVARKERGLPYTPGQPPLFPYGVEQ